MDIPISLYQTYYNTDAVVYKQIFCEQGDAHGGKGRLEDHVGRGALTPPFPNNPLMLNPTGDIVSSVRSFSILHFQSSITPQNAKKDPKRVLFCMRKALT